MNLLNLSFCQKSGIPEKEGKVASLFHHSIKKALDPNLISAISALSRESREAIAFCRTGNTEARSR